MGRCIFCGQEAGMLRKKHVKCECSYKSGFNKMAELVRDVITLSANFDELDPLLNQICHDTFNQQRKQEAILSGWDLSINHFLEDGVLSAEEEVKIDKFMKHFKFNLDDLDKNNSYTRIVHAKLEKLTAN